MGKGRQFGGVWLSGESLDPEIRWVNLENGTGPMDLESSSSNSARDFRKPTVLMLAILSLVTLIASLFEVSPDSPENKILVTPILIYLLCGVISAKFLLDVLVLITERRSVTFSVFSFPDLDDVGRRHTYVADH